VIPAVPFFAWIESTALSQWIVGSLFAFPVILTLHAVGMGFAAGLGAMVDLRLLGVGRQVPVAELRRFMPVLWAGFWLNAASGLLLLIGYPTKALTNPVFYLKLTLIAIAMVLLRRISREAFIDRPAAGDDRDLHGGRLRRRALVSLACWVGAITAGRLLAYTYTHLTAGGF
jgi:hypothetical protein